MPISLVNIDVKILHKILANRIHHYIKRIRHHDPEGFIPEVKAGPILEKSM